MEIAPIWFLTNVVDRTRMNISNEDCQQMQWRNPSLAGWVGRLIRASHPSDTPLAYWPNTSQEPSILSVIECARSNIDQIYTSGYFSHSSMCSTAVTDNKRRSLKWFRHVVLLTYWSIALESTIMICHEIYCYCLSGASSVRWPSHPETKLSDSFATVLYLYWHWNLHSWWQWQ